MLRNLWQGLKLALFLPVEATRFRATLGALIAVLALGVASDIALGFVLREPGATFTLDALPDTALGITAALAAIAAFGVCLKGRRTMLRAGIFWQYGLFWALLGGNAISAWGGKWFEANPHDAEDADRLILLWCGLLCWRAASLAAPRAPLRQIAGAVLYMSAVFLPSLVSEPEGYWVPPEDASPPSLSLNAEDVLEPQPKLLKKALGEITPRRPGRNAYIVTFAGDGAEDVFMKEALYAKDALAHYFHAEGHALALINNPATLTRTPLATLTNLKATLRALGAKADRQQDLLVLYLTSHGSEDGLFSVALGDITLHQLNGATLRAMLDDSGFRWKAVIISSCYSGQFLPFLQSDDTLIITAAKPDRTSFGCGSEEDFTFFGDAFFRQALPHAASLPKAFAIALRHIETREQHEGYAPPSEPQLFLGSAIRTYLDARSHAQ